MSDDVLLWVVVVFALGFDFTNGFHDTANAVATSVSTRALTPRTAVLIAAVMNLVGAFAWTAVAETVGNGLLNGEVSLRVLFAALLGAIAWNLLTWRLGLPSSSSHALIGGLIGAAVAANGTKAVDWGGVWHKVIVPAAESPLIGFVLAGLLMVAILWAFRRMRPAPLNRSFRRLQIASGSLMAFLHGTNDAQKTMGVIALALYSTHHISSFYIPWYVKLSAGLSLGIGTYVGGWRIMRTMGTRITKLESPQGFAAQTTASLVLAFTAAKGFPISTTQVISGSVMGAGATTKLSAVRWGVAANIVLAWVVTLPVAAVFAAAAYRALGPFT
jgi:PiT family inorganic phosphate transporter